MVGLLPLTRGSLQVDTHTGGGGQSASSCKTSQQPPSQLGPAGFNSHPAQCGDRMPPSDSTGGSQVLTGDGSPDTRGDGPGIHQGGRPAHPPDFSEPPPHLSRSSLPTAAPEAPTRQHRSPMVTFFYLFIFFHYDDYNAIQPTVIIPMFLNFHIFT